MAEPHKSILSIVAAVILEATGLTLPPLVWALVGAAILQAYSTQTVGRFRAMAQVSLSCMAGALIGVSLAEFFVLDSANKIHLLSLVGGMCAQPILNAIGNKVVEKINAA